MQRDLVGRLAKAGIFVEATGQVRHRRFRYDLYTQLVLVAHHQPKVIVSFALAAPLLVARHRSPARGPNAFTSAALSSLS
jgi:hypothetical protein